MGRDLTVVIVTYNSCGDLDDCLSSLEAQCERLDLEIVVADSGSTDATASIAERFAVTYLPGRDEGFARACNRALAHVRLADHRYVLFLNPDTAIRAGSLAELVAACDARPDHHLFTVRQVDSSGRLVHTLRRFPGPRRYWAEALPVGPLRRSREKLVASELYDGEHECDWAMGSFLLLSRTAVHVLGGFDERFFLYSEEVDLCRRARGHGWSVTYLPCMTIEHKGQSRVRDRRRTRNQARGKLIYADKWLGRRNRLLMQAALAVGYGRASLAPGSSAARASGRAALREVLSYRSSGLSRTAPAGNTQPAHPPAATVDDSSQSA